MLLFLAEAPCDRRHRLQYHVQDKVPLSSRDRARVIACAMGSFLALIADHHTAEDGLPGEGSDPATDDGMGEVHE